MPDPISSLVIAAILAAVGLYLFWPQRGPYWRWQGTRQMSERVLIEDALRHIHLSALDERCPTIDTIAAELKIPPTRVSDLLRLMEGRKLLTRDEETVCLTAKGEEYALQVIRAHRLWERYLAEQSGFQEHEWHERAHQQEHLLSAEEIESLAAELNYPTHDPHGDPIPTAEGRMVVQKSVSLDTLSADQSARIVHLEDEPPAVYAQLVAEELHPGMELRVIESGPERVRFWAEGTRHTLAPMMAANVSVVPVAEEVEVAEESAGRLSDLRAGEAGEVLGISHRLRGTERRRFLDFGILPGTRIEAAMVSPSGDPTAYLVRGTLLALRKEQAKQIMIKQREELV
jgi:DtxR family Mn-dependent transcriptional regulator